MLIDGEAGSGDPRSDMSSDELRAATLRAAPEVARPAKAGDSLVLVVGLLGALGLGALTLMGLARSREVPPPVPTVAKTGSTPVAPASEKTATIAPTAQSALSKPAAPVTAAPAVAVDPNQSRAMPLIIDNTALAAAVPASASSQGAAAAATQPAGLNQDELFALRAGNDSPPVAHAVGLGDPASTVVQGTIIPAVLETALNSDLPGFVRAIVSRDVRGFDGSQVLIPRGSRLIGQYKSGLATGQSRAYIMWTRLLRPDGMSVQLASPVMDEGSEVGLPGEVKRHFWQRFGSSILLSVVSGAASSLGDGSNAVVIGTSGTQSAASMALETDGKIPPTIRVPLGTPIQVFTARDLDFSGQQASPALASLPISPEGTPP